MNHRIQILCNILILFQYGIWTIHPFEGDLDLKAVLMWQVEGYAARVAQKQQGLLGQMAETRSVWPERRGLSQQP